MKTIFNKLLYLIIAVLILTPPLVFVSCDSIDTDILSMHDDTYSIGSVLLRWHDIYYGGTLYGGNAWFTDVNVSGNIISMGTIAGWDLEAGNDLDVVGSIYLDGSIVKYDALNQGGYWHEYKLNAAGFDPGASGATYIIPSANSTGGWQLNAVAETIYAGAHIDGDWDGSTDPILEIVFEINVAGVGGGDTVDIQIVFYMKGEGETATKIQTVEVATIVGAAAQFTQFEVVFTIDHDDGVNPVELKDVIAMAVNLETDTSEVDDITINYGELKYQTFNPAEEVP